MRGKENFHSLLDTVGSVVIKDEEKAEVHNTLFASVFNNKPILRTIGLLSW